MDKNINKIICGNCVDIMKSFPNNCIDLTVTSPPYDKLRNYNGYHFDFKSTADQLLRVTKKGGVVVWVSGDSTIKGSETGTSFKQALYFKEIGFNLHDTMIYMKNGPAYPSSNRYYSIFEYMFILSLGRPRVFNPIKDRKNRWVGQKWSSKRTRRNKKGELTDGKWDPGQGGEFGVRFNAWKYNVGHNYTTKDKIAYEHPAIFPEKLAEDHIISWSGPGDLILDPLCGSGTTCKMAKLNNRDYIGIDESQEYCDISINRIESVGSNA